MPRFWVSNFLFLECLFELRRQLPQTGRHVRWGHFKLATAFVDGQPCQRIQVAGMPPALSCPLNHAEPHRVYFGAIDGCTGTPDQRQHDAPSCREVAIVVPVELATKIANQLDRAWRHHSPVLRSHNRVRDGKKGVDGTASSLSA